MRVGRRNFLASLFVSIQLDGQGKPQRTVRAERHCRVRQLGHAALKAWPASHSGLQRDAATELRVGEEARASACES